jgi:hypothetical protein
MLLPVPRTREVVLEFDTSGGVFSRGKIMSAASLAVPAAPAAAGLAAKRRACDTTNRLEYT